MFRRLACSFCGRRAADVSKLVAGPRAYICDRCIEAASEIIHRAGDDESQPPRRHGFWRRMVSGLARVRALGRHWLLNKRYA